MSKINKFLGFFPALYGDIAMSTVCARVLKTKIPDCHLTFIIGNDFKEIAPVFKNQLYIDEIYITHKNKDGFDEEDVKWIVEQKFDGIFNPMADHNHFSSSPWWTKRIQTLEACHMHGLIPDDPNEIGKIQLIKWFDTNNDLKDFVAIAPFPAWYAGLNNDKALNIERAQEIVNFVLSLGYKVLQVGHPDEPNLEGAIKLKTDYFTSLKNVLSCKMMIMGDSGLNWVLSGYDFPVLGLYSNKYYTPQFVKNIQPINPNGVYLSAPNVNNIPMESIKENIERMLKIIVNK